MVSPCPSLGFLGKVVNIFVPYLVSSSEKKRVWGELHVTTTIKEVPATPTQVMGPQQER